MFTKSAHLYDAIYSFVDYAAEAELLKKLILERKTSHANELLDVACGTGQHISYLKNDFQIEGLDLQPEMLAIAAERNPEITFHHADMIDFNLGKQFDAIVCMFSSIGFVRSLENMRLTMANFAAHLKPGGVLIVEPWVLRDAFIDGHLGSAFIDKPEIKIARINTSKRVGDISVLDLHYLVGTAQSIEHFDEHHELGLFTEEQYLTAAKDAGLSVRFEKRGPKYRDLYDRGLFIATR